jgi:hypothetical protein
MRMKYFGHYFYQQSGFEMKKRIVSSLSEFAKTNRLKNSRLDAGYD